MLNKKELGHRLRMARFEKGLTLKEVAARCGMSATHISEVERGKTSPTIGALQRITEALGENPAHFVREESLPRVVFTRAGEACTNFIEDGAGQTAQFSMLSKGVAGGIAQVLERMIQPGAGTVVQPHIAELVIVCFAGMIRITASGETHVLREGDSIQLRMDEGYEAEVIGDEPHRGIAVFAAPVLIPA